jgi:MoaA/NifB/PqqE/SkfB family radical SAM enzyme
MRSNQVPYALYTTCPEPLFSTYRDEFFGSGIIDNLSCGVDYAPLPDMFQPTDDSYKKSIDALKGLAWLRDHYPDMDAQGTITVHKGNLEQLPNLVNLLTYMRVFIGINFIHWNKDGQYDFFPSYDEIEHLLFKKEDSMEVTKMMFQLREIEGNLIQNPEFIIQRPSILTQMGWHCKGNPYGGPTIDADGQLRCCGYRRGTHTPVMSIFDLPGNWDIWKDLVYKDAMECPGCAWSYPWMYHYWEATDPRMGEKVFVKHAGRHISKDKWSKRKIE